VFWQDADADFPCRQFDCEGQNHRRLSTSDSKLDHSKKGTVCQVKYKLLQM
jgi:hypothetical protein